jgi:hypothetical protein
MPIIVTFDLDGDSTTVRNRIQSMFHQLGWQQLGGTSYRYPPLENEARSVTEEDWFNHVIPALALLRAFHFASGTPISRFSVDCQSSTGWNSTTGVGHAPVSDGSRMISPVSATEKKFGTKNLRDWIHEHHFPYSPNASQPEEEDDEE